MVVGPCFSLPGIFHANPFQLVVFLLRYQLIPLLELSSMWLLFSLAVFTILFAFKICQFNYDVSWSGPLWVHLDLGTSVLPKLVTFFFTKLGNFSVIIFSNRFSIPCSFCLLLIFLSCKCCFMLSRNSLKLSLFFFVMFCFVVLTGYFFLLCLPVC